MTERRMIQLEDVAIAWWFVFVYGITPVISNLSPTETWIVFIVLCGVSVWAGVATFLFWRGNE